MSEGSVSPASPPEPPAPPPPPPPPPAGSGLPVTGDLLAGKYRIERLIGEGGMGAVYVAEHEILHQKVAIKLLLPDVASNEEAVARFLNEARAAARIRNEHVASVMDVGKLDNGSAFMVLEYLEGKDLSGVLKERGQLPIEEAVDYLLQALEAIAQAHVLGIVHRDLKPANLFLTTRQDGSPIIKVLDFGISKATHAPIDTAVTNTRAVLGSPRYMSPEQVRSAKHVDARTDIWAMGIILYRLLTNTVPFEGENLGAVFAAILEEDPAPVNVLRPEIPDGLEAVVAKCLQRPREARYQNAAELALALQPYGPSASSHSVDRICRTLSITKTPAPMVAPIKSPSSPTGPQAIIDIDGDSAAQGSTAAPWSANSRTGTPRKLTTRLVAIGAVALLATGFILVKLASPSSPTPAVVVSAPPEMAAALPAVIVPPIPSAEPAQPPPIASAAASTAPAASTSAPVASPVASTAPSAATRPIAPKSSTSVKPAGSASAAAPPATKPPGDSVLNNRN